MDACRFSVIGCGLMLLAGYATAQSTSTPPANLHAPRIATLPNGASSINETYCDWSFACTLDDGPKTCVLSQAQGNKQT